MVNSGATARRPHGPGATKSVHPLAVKSRFGCCPLRPVNARLVARPAEDPLDHASPAIRHGRRSATGIRSECAASLRSVPSRSSDLDEDVGCMRAKRHGERKSAVGQGERRRAERHPAWHNTGHFESVRSDSSISRNSNAPSLCKVSDGMRSNNSPRRLAIIVQCFSVSSSRMSVCTVSPPMRLEPRLGSTSFRPGSDPSATSASKAESFLSVYQTNKIGAASNGEKEIETSAHRYEPARAGSSSLMKK
jgi:hypothetical protein